MPTELAKSSSEIQSLATRWIAWVIGCIIVMTCHWATGVASRAYEAPLILKPHKSIQIRIISLFGQAIETELIFQCRGRDQRANELGEWRTLASPFNVLVFPEPGKRVALHASVNDREAIDLEAMPAGAFGAGFAVRKLAEDVPIDRHRWPYPPRSMKLRASPGANELVLTVSDVDPVLAGEQVTVLIQPPLGVMGGSRAIFS